MTEMASEKHVYKQKIKKMVEERHQIETEQ